MITISNSVFDAQGADKKAAVFGITLGGAEDILIKGCEFKNMGYSSILNEATANVVIEDCKFNCENVYNPIEGSQRLDNGNVEVKNCEFVGAPGNNYINFYQFAEGSKHVIADCKFNPTVDNNIVRVSNRTSVKASFDVSNCEYNFVAGEPTDYTNFLLCQDYTSKSGVPQDFTGCVFNIENLACNGAKVGEEGPIMGGLYYVYVDGVGLTTGQGNDPVIKLK